MSKIFTWLFGGNHRLICWYNNDSMVYGGEPYGVYTCG